MKSRELWGVARWSVLVILHLEDVRFMLISFELLLTNSKQPSEKSEANRIESYESRKS